MAESTPLVVWTRALGIASSALGTLFVLVGSGIFYSIDSRISVTEANGHAVAAGLERLREHQEHQEDTAERTRGKIDRIEAITAKMSTAIASIPFAFTRDEGTDIERRIDGCERSLAAVSDLRDWVKVLRDDLNEIEREIGSQLNNLKNGK